MLRTVTNAPGIYSNQVISKDLNVPSIREKVLKDDIKRCGTLHDHPNKLTPRLLDNASEDCHLKRCHHISYLQDLSHHFN